MIITGLLNLVYTVVNALLVFSLPSFPQSVVDAIATIRQHLVAGIGVLRAFLGDRCLTVLATLFGLILAMNAAYLLYSLVFWVIRKIPMFSVRE